VRSEKPCKSNEENDEKNDVEAIAGHE